MKSQIGKTQNHLEKRNPKSGKHKTTWKNEIPNRESIKPLGKMKSQIGTTQNHLEKQQQKF